MRIKQAQPEDLSEVARLFNLYRQFYDCDSDLSVATEFISDRMTNRESVIFLAEQGQGLSKGCGFVQLYPSFCSVEAIKIYILYDLFVESEARKQGVAKQLMNRATEYARANGAERIDLLTAKDNIAGQRLYESLGYERANEDFLAYSLAL